VPFTFDTRILDWSIADAIHEITYDLDACAGGWQRDVVPLPAYVRREGRQTPPAIAHHLAFVAGLTYVTTIVPAICGWKAQT
jgi:hypothetical protein